MVTPESDSHTATLTEFIFNNLCILVLRELAGNFAYLNLIVVNMDVNLRLLGFLPTLVIFRVMPGSIKQTVCSRRWGGVGETGGPAHSDDVAICRSSNA